MNNYENNYRNVLNFENKTKNNWNIEFKKVNPKGMPGKTLNFFLK